MNAVSTLASILRKIGLYRQVSMMRFKWLANRAGMQVSEAKDVISITKGNRRIDISAKNPAYANDIITWFDYYHSAVKPVISDGIATVDYSSPKLHRLSKSGIEITFPGLPESDESIIEYVAALNLQPGDIVLDLGAYAGASTYFLSKAVGPDGLVLAFEPDETNFRFLEENVARHKLHNVKCLKCGVWESKTDVHFQMEGNPGSGVVSLLGRNSSSKMASMITLNDVSEIAGGKRIAGIKMDIEGSELPVIRSAGEFLTQHRPNLVVEPHFVDGKLVTDEVCALLKSYGFSIEMMSQGSQDWPLIVAEARKTS